MFWIFHNESNVGIFIRTSKIDGGKVAINSKIGKNIVLLARRPLYP